MLFHAAWATVAHASRREEPKLRFHKLSVVVWAIRLLPYISGMLAGMRILK
jgi:hypothetical protein